MNISYYPQYIFNDCRNPDTGWPLYFDFYLPEYNAVIEYQGEQHYLTSARGYFNEEELVNLKKRDEYKKEYCKMQQINFIEIPYYHFNQLDEGYLKGVVLSADSRN